MRSAAAVCIVLFGVWVLSGIVFDHFSKHETPYSEPLPEIPQLSEFWTNEYEVWK